MRPGKVNFTKGGGQKMVAGRIKSHAGFLRNEDFCCRWATKFVGVNPRVEQHEQGNADFAEERSA